MMITEVVEINELSKAPRFIKILRLLGQMSIIYTIDKEEIRIPLSNFKWEPKKLVEEDHV